jgi:hypothetical protein
MAQPITTVPFRPSFSGSFEELYNPPELAGKFLDVPGFYGSDGFDLGTASNSNLTQTTAAPADGPSGALGADAERPANPYGLDPSTLSDDNKLQLMMFGELIGQRSTPEDDMRKFRMIQTLQREDAERANKMGRKNMLLGSLLKDIPKAVTNMAMAGTVYNAQNAVGPYNAAQYGRRYFT